MTRAGIYESRSRRFWNLTDVWELKVEMRVGFKLLEYSWLPIASIVICCSVAYNVNHVLCCLLI